MIFDDDQLDLDVRRPLDREIRSALVIGVVALVVALSFVLGVVATLVLLGHRVL